MGATEDKSLTVHTKKNFKKKEKKDKFHHKKKEKKEKKTKRDPSSVQCYTCDENIHFARDCPMRKRRHRAHVVEQNELTNKIFRREKDDSDDEYVLISTFTNTISHGRNDLLVDSGAYKHMAIYKESFVNMSNPESYHKVKLGDVYQYPIKGSG